MYCEKCKLIFSGNDCPACGSKNIRSPLPDDLCYLTEKEAIWSDVLEDILKQNGIPVFTKGTLGAGMALKVGPMLERVKFYVHYSHFIDAKNIVENFFSEAHSDT